MVDFSDLKKMRKQSSIQEMQTAIAQQEQAGGKREEDTRFWRAEQDKAGNGSAVIRFLPKTDQDKLPWVKLYKYSFKGPTNKWYIENSRRTLGEDDPVAEANNVLWNTNIKENQEIVKKQKRRTVYITNVLVVDDPANPDNNGTVRLFAFGSTIYDMLVDKINPEFKDQEPIDIFNLWDGANFRLRIRKKDGYANYDKSGWDEPSEVADGEEEDLIRILNGRHFLGDFIDPKNFKPYDVLKKRYEEVVNGKAGAVSAAQVVVEEDEGDIPSKPAPVKTKQVAEKKIQEKKAPKLDDDDEVDTESFKAFQDDLDDDVPF